MTCRRIANKIVEILEKVFSAPKSFYISLYYFPFLWAIRLPIKVRYNTKICKLSGKILLNSCLCAKSREGGGDFGLRISGNF